MGFVWTILIGGALGALATFSVLGKRSGYIVNGVLGSLGGLVATYLGQDFGWNGPNDGAGPIGAVVGAVFLVAARRAIDDWRQGYQQRPLKTNHAATARWQSGSNYEPSNLNTRTPSAP